LSRWAEPWKELGLEVSMELHADLRHRYSEPHRAYHTLHHLAECMQLLEQTRGLAQHPAEVEIALWFHDAIYDPRKTDNEQRSAEWAQRALRRYGASIAVQDRVTELIMVTTHQGGVEGADARLMSDIDLAILGAGRARFDEYERQVRREYRHVPHATYKPERRRLLTAFLERPRIYHTEWFRERRETMARSNLQRALNRLAGWFS
jgi:predicted metal-dependent HD superfamily phosphohydrolase